MCSCVGGFSGSNCESECNVKDPLVCVCVMCMSMLVELFAPAWKTINTCTTLNL